MQSLIVGLLLAGVSAISLVAFRYQNGYAKLFPYLIVGVSVLFIGAIIWHVAIETMWDRLRDYLVADFLEQATVAKNQLSLSFAWSAIGYLGILAFLWVNLRLPPFLNRMDNEDAH
ncbi:MAG: hypothetical protein KJO82_04685 [Gammaproteobacteria bacterium]|nr:hypothetical protein [Gammaproteobacteria bacterium]